ncbi:hypothetical protein PGH07_10590 [Sulfurovum sp. zt1-1]|uniref:Uncharacterized protein n=1 Tax=Sulfurovum zhangzhouensis TaxID=3019067 RepID=A0ABT7R0P6_9BACT|nr:hypothetical protein [Sulfurovum zhangzhouensis]MDM5272618.1 hypothetical protein [Sulfurovum zhangzhouensis]
MQMVKKIGTVIAVLWLAIIVMMPKQEMYYLLEQELAKNDIKISSEKISESWFTLSIKEPSIYVKGIKVATIKEIHLFTLLFYTRGSLEGLLLDRSLERFAPKEIDQAVVTYSVVNPLNVVVGASGVFGEADGTVNLMQKHVKMKFSQSQNLGMLRSKLKKDGEGWLYETSF